MITNRRPSWRAQLGPSLIWAGASVVLLVVVERVVQPGFVMWPLFPGQLVGMVVFTGAHGGTEGQEWLALAVGSVINTALYGFALAVGRSVLGRIGGTAQS